MRALRRSELESALADYLEAQQEKIDAGADVRVTWKAQRQTALMKRIAAYLRKMSGSRERCMYCEDSRGTDFEHFWPKQRYPERAFLWLNLLLACAACNRAKGDRFPKSDTGSPLLIDPTACDPWDFLFYDPETDELTPRWNQETGEEHLEGLNTLEILTTLRHQAISEGRGRTRRNLERAVRAYLSAADSPAAEVELRDSFRDNDGYGLTCWFLLREGQEEPPFSDLRRRHPRVWERLSRHVSGLA